MEDRNAPGFEPTPEELSRAQQALLEQYQTTVLELKQLLNLAHAQCAKLQAQANAWEAAVMASVEPGQALPSSHTVAKLSQWVNRICWERAQALEQAGAQTVQELAEGRAAYKAVVEALGRILEKLHPQGLLSAGAWRQTGEQLRVEGDGVSAGCCFQRALECDPHDHLAAYALGLIRREQRRCHGALALFQQAASLAPHKAKYQQRMKETESYLREHPEQRDPATPLEAGQALEAIWAVGANKARERS